MDTFLEEMMKIAAAGKLRVGVRSLRASTLGDKQRVDKQNSSLKTAAGYGQSLIRAAKSPRGQLAGAALGGAFGYQQGSQAYKDWKTGRTYRQQVERAQRRR